MMKIRERILEERWQVKRAELSFSCKMVEFAPLPGEIAETSFVITTGDGSAAEGFLRADDERMLCQTPWFSGKEETVLVSFDARGLEDGESREGFLQIISDCGEYRLPYRVTVKEKVLHSSLGEVRNLLQFTNVVRASWQEGVKLFYHPDFGRILEGEDERVRNLYRGFSAVEGNEQNAEQFLVAAGRKQPVSYSCAQTLISVPNLSGTVKEELTINRNGWGAIFLKVKTVGEFLRIDKKYLTEDDFLGNQCKIPIYIEESALGEGRNFGKVEFAWTQGSFCVDVVVERRNLANRTKELKKRQAREYTFRMMRLYEQLRMKKITAAQWQQDAAECVENMLRLKEQNAVPRLFKAHLLINQGKMEEAEWILSHAEPLMDMAGPAEQCYYLYLDTLCVQKESYVRTVERKMLELFDKNPGEWRIAWLLLFISRELNKNASARWQLLEECFKQGCISPVLYLEAVLLLNANPALLPKLDGYVLRILYYGARNRILGRELIGQILHMSSRERYFQEQLYEILRICYEICPGADTLQAVCTLLVKGGKCGKQYYDWYRMGVEQNLRIARLYEHFMMSVDLEAEVSIPRSVLMYFAYQSDLDYEYAAYLYAYVSKQCREDADLYAAYEPQIRHFVCAQAEKGRVSRHLAYLYEEYLTADLLTAETGKVMAGLLAASEVIWKGEKGILVAVHTRIEGEERYAFSKQTALVPLYSRSDVLFLQDENGNRRLAEEAVKITPMFAGEKMEQLLAFCGCVCPENSLRTLEESHVCVEEKNWEAYRAISGFPTLESAYSQKVHGRLLQFFQARDMAEQLDELLEKVQIQQIHHTQRQEVIVWLVQRGFYEKAYQWLAGADLKKQDAQTLMRLCSSLLTEEKYTEDPRMTAMCAQAVMQGKYDVHILRQLAGKYEGEIRELEVVYQAAVGMELETFPVCERLVWQTLFCGADVSERTDLLRQYVREGGSGKVVCAFLHRCAVRYVMQDEPIHTYMIHMIGQMMRQKEKVSGMCEIAYQEYFARNKENRNPDADRLLARIGEKMYRAGQLLPVLKEYEDLLPQAVLLEDRSFVVFRGDREEPAWIHYRPVGEEEGEKPYRSMPMRHVCGGIFSADFLLFTGQTMQYFITYRQQDGVIAESGFLKAAAVSEGMGRSKYAMLGTAGMRLLEGQSGECVMALQEYMRTQHYVSGLFKVME